MKKSNKEKGFTLIELLVVTSLISILSSIALPQFAQFRVKAMDAASISDIKQMITYQEMFRGESFAYAGFDTADRTAAGVSILVNGETFKVTSLTANVEMICKASADGSSLVVAAKHIGSNTIFAVDLNNSGAIRKLDNQSSLVAAVIPDSTIADNLSGWNFL